MTDEEKKKKREKSWFEEFLYNVMMECTRTMINFFFDECLRWSYIDLTDRRIDWDEIEEWDF